MNKKLLDFYAPFGSQLLPLLSKFVKEEKTIGISLLSSLVDSIFIALSVEKFDIIQDPCRNILITLFAKEELKRDIIVDLCNHFLKDSSWNASFVIQNLLFQVSSSQY